MFCLPIYTEHSLATVTVKSVKSKDEIKLLAVTHTQLMHQFYVALVETDNLRVALMPTVDSSDITTTRRACNG